MPRVLFVRHGENGANLLRQLSHRVVDYGLTTRGEEQAELLAAHLAELPALSNPVVSSPLRRAMATAERIASRRGLAVRPDERLRELNVGSLDGRSDRAAWDTYHAVLERWQRGEVGARFPGGEDLLSVVNRLRAALMEAIETATADPLLVVAHGAHIRAAVPHLLREPAPQVDLPPAGYAIFELDGVHAEEGRMVAWGRGYPDW